VNLSLLGLDPRTLFRTETFHGSHRAAIKALAEGACDVTGTYARPDASGHVTTGAWSEMEGVEVRVLATFGAIPPDVLALRTKVAGPLHDKVLQAFSELCAEDKELVQDVFGGQELSAGLAPGYESLKRALEVATTSGIFEPA
jgi:ABC-type phosphate/phosphonate transport system substrate-binding protein